MKKIFFVIALTSLLVGCNYHLPDSGKKDLKSCPETILGLRFDYPINWEACSVLDNEISFHAILNGYRVTLVGNIREVDKEYANSDRGGYFNEAYASKFERINDLIMYGQNCGGGLHCNGLVIDGSNFYEIGWGLKSNQPIPENLNYVWVPNHEFTEDEIWQILRSVKKVN